MTRHFLQVHRGRGKLPMLEGHRFSERTHDRGRKEGSLKKYVRIDLSKHAATWKKLYAVQIIHTASSINQKYKVSSQDKSWGFC